MAAPSGISRSAAMQWRCHLAEADPVHAEFDELISKKIKNL